jgi:hypothetical protein
MEDCNKQTCIESKEMRIPHILDEKNWAEVKHGLQKSLKN